eukprot:TRINITY_DN74245_c0_g1_i1.p1 TRINITY_DN74245_c0_g1~~TRINITY_DN74245_c0_g1_i1.p1  ORF type:complete len:479 (-),score=59.79 TRINITY_DN74245_c0_g1_i1:348-1682(-)
MSHSTSRPRAGNPSQVISNISKKQKARELHPEEHQRSPYSVSVSDDDMSDDSMPLSCLRRSGEAVSRWSVQATPSVSMLPANCRILFDDGESSGMDAESEDDQIIEQVPISHIAQHRIASVPAYAQRQTVLESGLDKHSDLDDSDEDMPLWMVSIPKCDKKTGFDERDAPNRSDVDTSDEETPLWVLRASESSSCSSPSSSERFSNSPDSMKTSFIGELSEPVSQTTLHLRRLKAELTEFLHLNRSQLFRQQHRDKRQLKLKWAGSFKVGSGSTQPGHLWHVYKGRPGFVRHNMQSKNTGVFIQGVNSQKALTFEQKKAYTLATAIIEQIDPDYVQGEFVVQFALMNDASQYTKRHVDREDITYQYHLSLGQYTGAKLRTWTPDNMKYADFDNLNRILKFDGRLPHEVITDQFHGERFSVIYYKNYDHRVTEPMPIFATPQFVG